VTNAKRYDNYINGEWVAGADYSANINPSELSDTIGDYAKADLTQVHAAIDAARAAFPAYSTSGIQARHDSLDKVGTEILARREELGTLLAREEGKTLPEAIGEVTRPVELPDCHSCVENRPGPGLRQLRGTQTGRSGAGLRLGAGGNHLPRRLPGRRVQPGDGQWPRGR
jgi:hypothetical protein